ncbi:serine protease 7-like [Anopheles moucheti]|uniref:serine protease 7-like n=1 Tax=Anopheles moucheti TaxID=186751 RepID=UPI0022F09C62|nr:serine protease 7-like [Anopheles moucheti]
MLALLWKAFLVVVVLGCESVTAGDRPCQTRSAKPQQGRCVPVAKCPAIKQHLLRLQFRPADVFEAFLSERACSYGKDGTLHVCCTGKIASERRAELVANDAHQCPDECAALEDCPAVYGRSMVLQKRYDRRLHKLLRENFCHDKAGQLFVCCDPDRYPSSTTAGTRVLAKRVSWQPCVTPFGDDGKCVPPARCAMVDNPDTIASELEAFTIGCDPVANQSQLCCTESLLIFDQAAGKECETKEGFEGMCTESERCLDFIESDEKDVYVRRNWCYTNLQQVDYLCCAQNRIKEAPQIEFGVRAGEELSSCTTIVNRPGYCVPLAQCAPVARLLRQISARGTSATPDEARFLRGSICTTPEGATGYHVCCDVTAVQTTTTAAPATTAPTTVAPAAASLLNHPNAPLFDRSNCGLPGTNNKIAFGQQARLFQYPWMAMIVYMSSTTGTESSECAGTIINVRYILTAAHCIDGQMERMRYVRIGEFDTRTDPDCEEDTCAAPMQRYGVEDAVFHPNFTRIVRSGHDVGLLRLNRTIDFSSGDVSPVCLPFTSGLMGFDPTLYWITGWGLTERLEVSPVLLQARIPPVSCSLSSYAICAGFGNATLHCEGDSGGPMKAQVPEYNFRFVQYGVISAGPRCGTQGVPGISSRVSFFMQWILDNIKA